jgi:cation:H+ antiporter
MNPYVSLLIGVVCAGVGGELFVRGLVGLARWARISAGIIGTTVAAFATSSPEISVAIGAAGAGQPEISLGDALGSNVVNVALILALALCISPILSPRSGLKRDFPVALLVPVVIGLLGFDGMLSRLDGAVLLVLFLTWLGFVTADARKERSAAGAVLGESRVGRAVAVLSLGFVFLVGSGSFIVAGARGIATAFGIPEFVIGATVVALGTSMPELATAIISKVRGHDEIGLGTILGSNIFNGLFIVGLAASICPIAVQRTEVGAALVFGLLAMLVCIPSSDGWIRRSRGFALLVLYSGYIAVVLRR